MRAQVSAPLRFNSFNPSSSISTPARKPETRLAISLASGNRFCMSLEFIEPQLATAVDHPPPRAGWIHEVKHDGYRTLLIIERGKTRAYTRNGFDWSESYLGITKAAAKLDCRSAIIDGEIIVQNERGISDFESLKSAIRWRPQRLIFCAFDLLHLNGKDRRDHPLLERKARLKELIPNEHPFLFSEEFTGDADAFFQACADHQLEGIVSKLASSKYRSGRSKTWLKTKCFTEGSFLIIGTARDRKTKAPLALLAQTNAQGLRYAGSAFIALSANDRAELSARLQKLERCPIPKLRFPDAQWVKPQLTVRVRHLSGTGYVRHGTVRGFA
jgi:bifunctional non-homologous end joining protein LigD